MHKLAVSLLLISLITASSEDVTRTRPHVLTTATTGGTYYPVGVALATLYTPNSPRVRAPQ